MLEAGDGWQRYPRSCAAEFRLHWPRDPPRVVLAGPAVSVLRPSAGGAGLRFCISHLDLFRGVQMRAGRQTEWGTCPLLRGTASILVSWKNIRAKLVGRVLTH